MDVTPMESQVVSVLREDGSVDPGADPGVELERLVALYAEMREARVIDERLAALGDAGRIGFLPQIRGREALYRGVVEALADDDWIFPSVGDWPVARHRGLSIEALVHRVHGNARDAQKGHDMAAGVSSRGGRVACASAPAATHLPHAVGVAWAKRHRGEDGGAAALFDAAEVDAADFHTALNFAGVLKVPVLFVCRVQGEDGGAAEHAVAYGLEAARCDGADLLAVIRTIREARASGGPKVIDVVLSDEDAALARTRAHLQRRDAWDDEREASLVSATEEALASAIDAASRAEGPVPASIFDGVFATLPPHLSRQRAELLSGPRPS